MRTKPYIEGKDVMQASFLPECIDDIITKENPVRFICAYLEELDLAAMGFIRSTPEDTGRPGYDPAMLLKLYIYGHLNRIRSSRMRSRNARGTSSCGGCWIGWYRIITRLRTFVRITARH